MNHFGVAGLGRLMALIAVCWSGSAMAQDYPNKPVRVIVPTAPGGLMDVPARLVADHLDRALGQRMLVENRSGGGGNLGVEVIAKAAPDGYTIGLIQLGQCRDQSLHLQGPWV